MLYRRVLVFETCYTRFRLGEYSLITDFALSILSIVCMFNLIVFIFPFELVIACRLSLFIVLVQLSFLFNRNL